MTETIFGWHFVGKTLRDGRPVPQDGEWLHHDGGIVICAAGLHGSRHPFDALQYAPGATLCYCEFSAPVQELEDKFVSRSRRILARIDATGLLRYFARMQALSVAHAWEPTEVALEFLMTGKPGIRAAARAAAWGVAWAAARAAARAAAWAATRDAAWAAAQDAAWAAARAAAWDVAQDAAQDAAWTAARDAARAAARGDFLALVHESFGMDQHD